MDAPKRAVVVGAGHGGVTVAVALARSGDTEVVLLSDEAQLPYERPPLTKKVLTATHAPEPVLLRSEDYWERSPIDLRLDWKVVRVDPHEKVVESSAGELLRYDVLVWATGGRALSPGLPGEDADGVHRIRDFVDTERLVADLREARSAVVVGGGYIGLETAAAMRQRGLDVVVAELGPRVLGRVAGPVVSQFFGDLHRSHGVKIHCGVGVVGFDTVNRHVRGVHLADGTQARADVVVLGVGMAPNVAPLLDAHAKGDLGGLDVDEHCRTSLPDVFAIGDCVRQTNPWSVTRDAMRVESVHNAGIQAATVAAIVGGDAVRPIPPPRFWSTQFGREFKSVGLSSLEDEVVVRGEVGADFSVAYLRAGRLVAIDTVDRPKDFARGQSLVAAQWPVQDMAQLADPSVELPRP